MESPELFWHVTQAGYRRFGTANRVQNQGAIKGDNYTPVALISPSDEAILRIDSENRSKDKCKGTVHPRTSHEGPEGE
jgi:hypothetical protein